MNYMTEIKMFNEWLETNELSTSGIALWYALMYIANRSGWRPELCIPVSVLCLRTKLSRSAIYKERTILRDQGLIDFDTGDGRQSSNYRIQGFEERSASTFASVTKTQLETQSEDPEAAGPQASTVVSTPRTQPQTQTKNPDAPPEEVSTLVSTERTQSGTQTEDLPEESTLAPTTRTQTATEDEFVSTPRTQPCTTYKHKHNLSIDEESEINNGGSGQKKKGAKSPKKKKPNFDLSFIDDPVWESLVRTWLDYKKSRNEDYKSELSVKKFHTMLRNLSRGNPEVATKIVDKSIARNWAGIFELTDREEKPTGRPASGQHIGQIKQPEDEERRQKLLEKFERKKT